MEGEGWKVRVARVKVARVKVVRVRGVRVRVGGVEWRYSIEGEQRVNLLFLNSPNPENSG